MVTPKSRNRAKLIEKEMARLRAELPADLEQARPAAAAGA